MCLISILIVLYAIYFTITPFPYNLYFTLRSVNTFFYLPFKPSP
jgi:hypothetical protein